MEEQWWSDGGEVVSQWWSSGDANAQKRERELEKKRFCFLIDEEKGGFWSFHFRV